MIDYLEKKFDKFRSGLLDLETFDKTTDEIFDYCKIHNIPVGGTLAKYGDGERLITAFSYYDTETDKISVVLGEILKQEVKDD